MSDQSLTRHTANAQRLYDEAQEHLERGDFTTARQLHQQALALREEHLGPDHPDTARSLTGIAGVVLEQGEFPVARSLLERALEIQQQLPEHEHLDIARTLDNLGITRFVLGDPLQGRHLVEQAFALREKLLGNEHPDTIESMNHLGIILNRLGERDRALQIHRQALAICERVFGEQHRKTIESPNYLAVKLARNHHTYSQARTLYERALASSEQVLGTAHPMTMQLLNNLGAVLADLHEDTAAQGTLERSLTLHEQVLGPQHPSTAYVLINLGDVYARQDNHTARPLYERALIIREQVHGAAHPDTIDALEKLLTYLSDLSDMDDALDPSEEYIAAGTIYQSSAGPVAPYSDAALDALELYPCLMALKAANGTLDPDDQHMPGANADPAQAAARLHRIVERLVAKHNRPPYSVEEEQVLQQAAAIEAQADQVLNESDPATAQELLEQALTLREQIQGQYHMDHVKLLRKLIVAARAQRHLTAVQPLLERIAETHVQMLGEEHTATIEALNELAMFYSDEYGYNSPSARRLYERVQQAMLNSLGADDPNVRLVSSTLEDWNEFGTDDKDEDGEPSSARWERALATLRANPPAILSDIYTVDWENLEHAYGSAGDVPELLMLLLADDETIRDNVYGTLYSNIWHQGTVYEASAYAVPFLLRLLEHPDTPDKAGVMGLLASPAEGNSYLAVHHRENDETFNWREMLAEDGKDFDAELAKELSWVEAANSAVGQGVDLYFRLLDDEALRAEALLLLTVVRGHSSVIVPRLLELLQTTDDSRFREQLVATLRAQMDASEGSQQFFSELLLQQENENITTTAALALLERAREHTPDAVVNIIIARVHQIGSEEDSSYELHNIRNSLLSLGPARAFPVLLQALSLLHDPEEAENLAGLLLDLAFNAGEIQSKQVARSWDEQGRIRHQYFDIASQPPRDPATLTEQQRTLLATLVAHAPLWDINSDLLECYGLPTGREVLRAFLEQRSA